MLLITALGNILEKNLLFATAGGMLKQVQGSEFHVSKKTTVATKLNEADKLLGVYVLDAKEEQSLVLQSKKGFFLRFLMEDVPKKKKAALGVHGIKLEEKDEVSHLYLLEQTEEQVIEWKEKEIALHRLRIGKRDTKGVKK